VLLMLVFMVLVFPVLVLLLVLKLFLLVLLMLVFMVLVFPVLVLLDVEDVRGIFQGASTSTSFGQEDKTSGTFG
jgi:hypothetical protein